MMRKTLLTLIAVCAVKIASAQYAKIMQVLQFENVTNEEMPLYGSIEKPIESGAFINLLDAGSRANGMRKLYNSYRWPNGGKIDFSKRFSTKGGSKGIVDCYTLVNPTTKDTLRLYVDPYKTSEKYYIPKGLIALNSNLLKDEVEPILQQIQEINQAQDGEALKLHAGEILNYLSSYSFQNLLVDQDQLMPVMQDKEADKTLIGFLLRSYMFNKFYAMAKDLGNEKAYAYEKMKASYANFVKVHPDFAKGKLDDYFKP
ncbi:hypothetical protein ACQKCH_00740 [Nubsella zeaxanthinifaciens]|uniref:hypothetical protein n=1 Tax=Nubsella zeaxanthinifaciens TaxID=392412 RepID=UPI003D089F92